MVPILLRHVDDVVGTGPEEHLMNYFEHMKTSLYLTGVVVLCNEGDAVNFLGLETSRGSEVKKLQTSWNLFESIRVGKLETDCQSRWTLGSDGAPDSLSSGWS